jgi:hypothetical protein
MHDHVDHAVIAQIFGALEAGRQFLADGLFDHARAGESNDGAGLGDRDVAQHRERGRHAAGGGIGQDEDHRQAGFLDLIDGDDAARHLHERQNALLHPRAARCGDHDQRRVLQHGELGGGDEPFADRDAHRTAHEIELERRDDRGLAAHLAMRHQDRVAGFGLFARFLQAVGVALAVAEAQRIGGRLGQLDLRVAAFVEQHGKAALGRQAHVMVAMRAHARVGVEIAVKDHLAARVALVPQIVGDIGLARERTDLRADEIGEPVHDRSPRCRISLRRL